MPSIKLTEEDVRDFAYGDLDGFSEVKCLVDKNSLYKDYAPATTICKRDSDNTFWSLNWEQYCSHYGSGEHMFNETEIHQVVEEKKEVVVIRTKWVRV